MEIDFLGAAQDVTGSLHRVRTAHATILLDCGLFQGRRAESYQRNLNLPVDPAAVDAVVLSHAHIDHSGALPLLVRRGYQGPIYSTPATRDLAAVMLEDSAMIQAADAEHLNRQLERGLRTGEEVKPLYDVDDVVDTLSAMISVPYRRPIMVAPGIRVTFLDAGHVLGSAITVLDIDEDGARTRVVFTGDLGRRHMPILHDPEVAGGAHVLITESTYGDRLHDAIEAMDDELEQVVRRAVARGGKVVIPSFALERAQELVFSLGRLSRAGRLPRVPVVVDSPLTVKITEIFRMHPECYDKETRRHLLTQSPFDFDGLRYVSDREESKAISGSPESAVIISASGMCEGGRVLHHLATTVENERNTIVIVGFQAQHTLGRRLVERRAEVRVLGLMRQRRAEVVVLNGFSAHADQADLLAYAEGCRDQGPLRQVYLVHGEPKAQAVLAAELAGRGFPSVFAPARGETVRV